MSKERDEKFRKVMMGGVHLSTLLTSEIVELQLLCDAELQERADYYLADAGGSDVSVE